jgi:secretion/DNA translocation related CpaE-like protein
MARRRIGVFTADSVVCDEVRRLAALAGGEAVVDTAAGVGLAAAWRSVDAVVVGADLAAAVAAAGLPRRAAVAVVASGPPDADAWRAAVELGATCVLELPAGDERLVEFITDAQQPASEPMAGTVVAIVGAVGGAGASTLATAVALLSARSAPTMLVDADRFGGGLDLLLGAEQAPGARWPALTGTRGRIAADALRDAVLCVDGCRVVSWDRGAPTELDPEVADAVLSAAIRGHHRVVLDLPRHGEAYVDRFAAAADLVALVVPASVRAAAAGAATAQRLRSRTARIVLVVRDGGTGRPRARDVAAVLDLPLLTTYRSEPQIAAAAERGELGRRHDRGSLAAAASAVLNAVGSLA